MRALAPALVALVAVTIAGCGLGPGAPRAGTVRLRVTRDFGDRLLAAVTRSGVRPSDTVMRLLSSTRRVTTAYGGGFVQSIDGLAGDKAARRDWFFYVDGVEAQVGAADFPLAPGEVVQWDYHRWDATMDVPAIVGAFPEPFLHGPRGRRVPVWLECSRSAGRACATVAGRLRAAGAAPRTAPLGAHSQTQDVIVDVAPWAAARRLAPAAALAAGPARSGVFARFDSAGRRLDLLDGAGRVATHAAPDTGVLAATGQVGGPIVWLVTGAGERAVERAAHALGGAGATDAFAVATSATGLVHLPLPVSGR